MTPITVIAAHAAAGTTLPAADYTYVVTSENERAKVMDLLL